MTIIPKQETEQVELKTSFSELAIAVGISTHAIEKHLEKLKAQGIIERIGSAKGGYWEVLK